MIANLQFQRERVARELEREQERWTVERYGWERMAEALIAQRNRPGFGGTASEVSTHKVAFPRCANDSVPRNWRGSARLWNVIIEYSRIGCVLLAMLIFLAS